MSAAEAKQAVRREIRRRWDGVDPAWIEASGGRVRATLLARDELRGARVVCAYVAMAREVPSRDVLAALHARGQEVCVPRFDPEANAYRPARWRPGCRLVGGPHGAPEPEGTETVPEDAVDAWVVPGVAFDRRGLRLGRGGGWFDRMLATVPGARIGTAFEFQIVEAVPADPWDAAVDLVVTECLARSTPRQTPTVPPAAPDRQQRGVEPWISP